MLLHLLNLIKAIIQAISALRRTVALFSHWHSFLSSRPISVHRLLRCREWIRFRRNKTPFQSQLALRPEPGIEAKSAVRFTLFRFAFNSAFYWIDYRYAH
jgi:hypothetical protein